MCSRHSQAPRCMHSLYLSHLPVSCCTSSEIQSRRVRTLWSASRCLNSRSCRSERVLENAAAVMDERGCVLLPCRPSQSCALRKKRTTCCNRAASLCVQTCRQHLNSCLYVRTRRSGAVHPCGVLRQTEAKSPDTTWRTARCSSEGLPTETQ
jgi:hypothetical protein